MCRDRNNIVRSSPSITYLHQNLLSMADQTHTSSHSLLVPLMPDCRQYEFIERIGHGVYGDVFKARRTGTDTFVAMKRIKTDNEREGFPITAVREWQILQSLRHENIVNVIEVCHLKTNTFPGTAFYFILEFCHHDLARILRNEAVQFTPGQTKSVLRQILCAISHIHKHNILHRDLKPANILITSDGILKVADFGWAKEITPAEQNSSVKHTPKVVTRWYRPPELLLGERAYGKAIDMWSVGCIFAEIWTRHAIMQGTNDQNQLHLITDMCGSIENTVWPNVHTLPLYNNIKTNLPSGKRRRIRQYLREHHVPWTAIALIEELLTLDPTARISAGDSFSRPYFQEEPFPSDLGPLMSNCNPMQE